MEDAAVIIVGAGPAGLATSACLKLHSVPHIILEQEDCFAPTWNKYAYDSVRHQLKKNLAELPHFPYPPSYPSYLPKDLFLQYLRDYMSKFEIHPKYGRRVELAEHDEVTGKWKVKAKNASSGETEEYSARFLVLASGVFSDPYIPDVEGLNSFTGEVIHSTQFKNGKGYANKKVLVVGSGNSGTEIAVDFANNGAETSIIVRSPVHLVSREIANWAFLLLIMGVPMGILDWLLITVSKIMYGDTAKYGIPRPQEGVFQKLYQHKYPIFHDTGAFTKIKAGEIQVLPEIASVSGNEVVFVNGKSHTFDTIVFCTGFKRSTNKWLKDDDNLLDDDGFAKPKFPIENWRGKKGLYCVGLTTNGLLGIRSDAPNVADHINSILSATAN